MPHSVPYSEMHFAIVSGSRGCWNDCSFCSNKSIWGRTITYRSPKKIADELEYLVCDKEVNFVFFGDNDFLINRDWTKKLAEEIIDRNIRTNLHVMATVRSSSRFDNYKLLRNAGVREITIGMETTNQKLIDSMGKKYTISELPYIANKITSHGIHLGLYYMLGYPEQTQEDLEHDFNFIKKIPFSRIRAVFATPYPGTALYQRVERENLWLDGYRNDWSALTNDQPVIKIPVTPEKLIEARKRVLRLYFTDEYKQRMQAMCDGDTKSKQAFKEFQNFIQEVI